jgi:sec-independent protein translocase protein TatB
MFDLDVSKILLVAIVALVVVGPKDLPRVLRLLGQINGKLRRTIAQLRLDYVKFVEDLDPEAAPPLPRLDVSRDPSTAMRGRFAAPAGATASATPTRAAEEPIYASAEMRLYLGDVSELAPADDGEKFASHVPSGTAEHRPRQDTE